MSFEENQLPANAPRARGMTLVEILIVVLLIGVFVPATTASLSRQAQKQSLNINRELAAQLAEEGVELLIAGGFNHWYGKVRPAAVPVNPPYYLYSTSGTLPPPTTDDATLTVYATGQTGPNIDDVFNPFIGDLPGGNFPTPANPMQFRPWSRFQRQYQVVSRTGTGGTIPRILDCAVKVFYGPDPQNVIVVPLYIGNHWATSAPANGNLRGLLWLDTPTTLANPGTGIDSLANVFESRALWGKPPEQTGVRPLYDSSFPLGISYPP